MLIHSARDLAHGLNDGLKLGLTPRPWNLYSPADTFWWLSPSPDWPAYRYGKLAFSAARDAPRKFLLGTNPVVPPDGIFAGFNLEKGYETVATAANPALRRRPAVFVDPTWLWFEVMSPSGAAQFSRTLETAAVRCDLYLYVVVGPVHDPDDDQAGQRDALMFKCDGSRLEQVAGVLKLWELESAKAASSFIELADHLMRIDGYHWADVYVGTHVPMGDIDVLDLHDRVTSCFEPWLKG